MKRANSKDLLLIIIAIGTAALSVQTACAKDSTATEEYQLKAAFMYNFMKFVKWPAQKSQSTTDQKNQTGQNQTTVTIGIIGTDPFGDAIELLKAKKVEDRTVVIERFPGLGEYKNKARNKDKFIEEYQREYKDKMVSCDLMFISNSEQEYLENILAMIDNQSTLTIGESKDFVDRGGMINFVTEEQKVKFEINTLAASKAKLDVSSQLLRLAKRVITDPKGGFNKNPNRPSMSIGVNHVQVA